MNYQNSINTAASQAQIVQALTIQISDWWTEDFCGSATKINDKFTVRFGKTFKTFVVTELSADKVLWTCIDSFIDMDDLNKKDEWKGTKIHWAIVSDSRQNRLTILHEGLTPEIECFEVCEQGWISFLGSLKDWLDTHEGQLYKIPEKIRLSMYQINK